MGPTGRGPGRIGVNQGFPAKQAVAATASSRWATGNARSPKARARTTAGRKVTRITLRPVRTGARFAPRRPGDDCLTRP